MSAIFGNQSGVSELSDCQQLYLHATLLSTYPDSPTGEFGGGEEGLELHDSVIRQREREGERERERERERNS